MIVYLLIDNNRDAQIFENKKDAVNKVKEDVEKFFGKTMEELIAHVENSDEDQEVLEDDEIAIFDDKGRLQQWDIYDKEVIPKSKPNTEVTYLYRDASNYKTLETIVLEGQMTEEQIAEVIGYLDGEYFIPEQIGLYLPVGDEPTEDDHCFCELGKFDFKPTDNDDCEMTVEEFISRFKKASEEGWDDLTYSLG